MLNDPGSLLNFKKRYVFGRQKTPKNVTFFQAKQAPIVSKIKIIVSNLFLSETYLPQLPVSENLI